MYYPHECWSIKQSGWRWQSIHVFINVQAYITPAVDDEQLQMLLNNKVTGSVRGQYRHEVQSTEMNRDFVESKGLTNLGFSDAISRFWIRSSVDFKIPHAKFHILGRKAQPVRITFSCLDKKNVPFDGPFCRFFRMPLPYFSDFRTPSNIVPTQNIHVHLYTGCVWSTFS